MTLHRPISSLTASFPFGYLRDTPPPTLGEVVLGKSGVCSSLSLPGRGLG
jgi:hypothetical protein